MIVSHFFHEEQGASVDRNLFFGRLRGKKALNILTSNTVFQL